MLKKQGKIDIIVLFSNIPVIICSKKTKLSKITAHLYFKSCYFSLEKVKKQQNPKIQQFSGKFR